MVFSKSEEENVTHVSTVLARLRANNLFAKASKCLFHASIVKYLHYVVSSEGLTMDQAKFQQIINWTPPRNFQELQSFPGFANFYRYFIKNYSKKISSLTTFLKKYSHFPLNKEGLRDFQQLKEAFTIAPILSHFNPSLPTIVETDASDYACHRGSWIEKQEWPGNQKSGSSLGRLKKKKENKNKELDFCKKNASTKMRCNKRNEKPNGQSANQASP
ncbi:hypothetical protein O181_100983 [Austropuccinia psidii MF-1]|uniref:Reverse transcriptase/retrotransposon-derived protein RNase H-like domain-containing protein n=1 Tax=Austropuccinia psidii MF-1 TaxID=1389203 RepID=A0A9Q3JFN5_9BASI|nr:hypothetical protein [Austropuccinia psidii MF-1]